MEPPGETEPPLEPQSPRSSRTQEILAQLAENEQQKFRVSQEEGKRVRDAELKVQAAAEALMEMKRSQEQDLKLLRGRCDRRYKDVMHSCQHRLNEAESQRAQTAGRLAMAAKDCKTVEADVATLEARLADLKALQRRRQEDGERQLSGLQRVMNSRIQAVHKQSDKRIDDMAEHAKDVVSAATATVEERRALVQSHLMRAHVRAEGRVRFKELCLLARSWHEHELTAPQYRELKGELVSLWHMQKGQTGLAATTPPSTAPAALPWQALPEISSPGQSSYAS